MPLHTYTSNFATSSNVQEILSNIPFAHHVLFFSMALSFPQLLSIIRPIHLQILTQAPLFSHFPSKNLNKYTSSPKIPSKCLHDLAKSYHCTTTPHHLFNTSYL